MTETDSCHLLFVIGWLKLLCCVGRQHYETIYGGRDLSSSHPILYHPEDKWVNFFTSCLLASVYSDDMKKSALAAASTLSSRTVKRLQSLIHSGPRVWNSLSSKTKAINSYRSFTKSVISSLLDMYIWFCCLSLSQLTLIISSFFLFAVFPSHLCSYVVLYCKLFILLWTGRLYLTAIFPFFSRPVWDCTAMLYIHVWLLYPCGVN